MRLRKTDHAVKLDSLPLLREGDSLVGGRKGGGGGGRSFPSASQVRAKWISHPRPSENVFTTTTR